MLALVAMRMSFGFLNQAFASALIMSNPTLFKYDIVWHKNCPSSPALAKRQIMRQHELVLVFYNKQSVYNPKMEKYSESSKNRIKDNFNVEKKSEKKKPV